MIQLIATDLDGTLLQNGNRSIPEELFDYIHAYTRSGGIFVAASGRQYANLRRLFAPVRDEIAYICENGCLVIYKGSILFHASMERETGKELLHAIQDIEDCEILLSGVNTCYIESSTPSYITYIRDTVKNNTTVVDDIFSVTEPYFKISAYSPRGTSYFEDRLKKQFGEVLNVVTSGNDWLDVMPKGIHKGSAMKVLSDTLKIHSSEMMAIGDHYNDLEMLQFVGHPACVDNAQPEIKAICKYQDISGASLLMHFLKENSH